MTINPRAVVIVAETDDYFLRIGPRLFDGKLNNEKIKNIIREVMLENDDTHISYKDITEILVIAAALESHAIYQPNPRDVWPLDFGPKFDKFFDEEGGEKK